MISYAQNFEDVMIARLFPLDYKGFYIDVGAADPEYLSVTKHFYDAGWRGINVEPLPRFFSNLRSQRPQDINLQVAIGANPGWSTLYEVVERGENSTTDKGVLDSFVKNETVLTHNVEVMTLASLCERYAGGRDIDFLKIDVEGAELVVLKGGNWKRFRPVLVVVECVEINNAQENWQDWEPLLIENKYSKVWFDGLNNFYLREESKHLQEKFRTPPNVFDGFSSVSQNVEISALQRVCRDRLALIQDLEAHLQSANNVDRDRHMAASQNEIVMLQTAADERLALIEELQTQFRTTTAATERDIAALRAAADERLALIEELQTQLRAVAAARETDIAALQAAADERLALIEELQTQLRAVAAARESDVAALQAAADERLDLIKGLEAQLQATNGAREKEIADLQAVADERLTLIRTLHAQLQASSAARDGTLTHGAPENSDS